MKDAPQGRCCAAVRRRVKCVHSRGDSRDNEERNLRAEPAPPDEQPLEQPVRQPVRAVRGALGVDLMGAVSGTLPGLDGLVFGRSLVMQPLHTFEAEEDVGVSVRDEE